MSPKKSFIEIVTVDIFVGNVSMFDFKRKILSLLFPPLQFFTSALADGFSLEFEWQQVSTSLQDSSQYSGRSQ